MVRSALRCPPQALARSRVNEVLVSVVVPTFREADNLPLLVPQITTALEPWSHEIIVVDDDSNDGTDQAVATLSEQGHAVRLIIRTDQRGLSSAVLRGFFEAKGRVLVCMDADLSHPPEILPRMIETFRKGSGGVCHRQSLRHGRRHRCGMELVSQPQQQGGYPDGATVLPG